MKIDEKISFFLHLINCNYNLYYWTYSSDSELLATNSPPELITSDITLFIAQNESILDYAKSGNKPYILETPIGILWIADFERKDGELQKIHFIGPVYTGNHSYHLLRQRLDHKPLSIKTKSQIFKQIDFIPIIPTNVLYQYATMFHYCITGENISIQDIQYNTNSETYSDMTFNAQNDDHRGIWLAEQALVKMFREGNPDYKKELENIGLLSSGIKFDVGDSVRQKKTSLMVLLTLCSRATIEGGLSPSISYARFDHYTQCIEEAATITELTSISGIMLEDYMQRLHIAKENTQISKQIQDCCAYISAHIKERISIQFLADRIGYSKYYLSRKFKSEIGYDINVYIKRQKVEQAKLLLSSTRRSIQEISDEFSFCSRSHFFESFKKITKMSPSEYRDKNLKL